MLILAENVIQFGNIACKTVLQSAEERDNRVAKSFFGTMKRWCKASLVVYKLNLDLVFDFKNNWNYQTFHDAILWNPVINNLSHKYNVVINN